MDTLVIDHLKKYTVGGETLLDKGRWKHYVVWEMATEECSSVVSKISSQKVAGDWVSLFLSLSPCFSLLRGNLPAPSGTVTLSNWIFFIGAGLWMLWVHPGALHAGFGGKMASWALPRKTGVQIRQSEALVGFPYLNDIQHSAKQGHNWPDPVIGTVLQRGWTAWTNQRSLPTNISLSLLTYTCPGVSTDPLYSCTSAWVFFRIKFTMENTFVCSAAHLMENHTKAATVL